MKLQAKQRLLAWKPNNVPKSGGDVRLSKNGKIARAWRSAFADYDEGLPTPPETHRIPVDGGSIDRFEGHMQTFFVLVIASELKGYLSVDVFDNVNASFIDPSYQGKGWATKLYGEAIKYRGVLKSDSSISGYASILWRSLAHKFDVRYKWSKDYEVEIVGWHTGVGGYVYPEFKQPDGSIVNLEQLYDSTDQSEVDGAIDGVYIARPK